MCTRANPLKPQHTVASYMYSLYTINVVDTASCMICGYITS